MAGRRFSLWALALLLAAVPAAPRCTRRRAAEVVCATALDMSQAAPRTAKRPVELAANASFSNAVPRTRLDEYAWLRDDGRNDSAVLKHLQEENAYAEAVMAPSKPLQQRLLAEMLGRIPQEESSAPQRQGLHWYYTSRSAGKQYRRHCRRPVGDPAVPPSEHDAMNATVAEEVLLDEDELAANRSFFDLRGLTVSPDEQLAAYGVDLQGGEVYTLFVRNLTAREQLVDPEAAGSIGGGVLFGDEFSQCSGEFVFLSDNRTLLFTTLTPDTHRADKVWRFDPLAAPVKGPGRRRYHRAVLQYHEPDERFHLAIWRSRSDATVFLAGGSDTTHYLLYLPVANSTEEGANFTSLAPPVPGQQFLVRDWHAVQPAVQGSSQASGGQQGGAGGTEGRGLDGGADGGNSSTNSSTNSSSYLYAVVYTEEQRNGQLVVVALGPNALVDAAADEAGQRRGNSSSSGSGGGEAGDASGGGGGGNEGGEGNSTSPAPFWALLKAHSRDVEIVDITVSSSHLAVLERKNGTLVATAYPLPSDGTPLSSLPEGRQFSFEAPSYALWLGDQGPFESSILRVKYSSLAQPLSTYDIGMKTGNRVLKQQQEVQGFDHSHYLSRLLWASSTGGAQVPISLAYRADLAKLDGTDPLLLEAYGAYGVSYDPEFSGERLSLLDRGFVFAIAHVRGGGELGRYWAQDGKLLAKNHTFDDVAAAASFLIQAKYTSARRLALWGRSAGGLTAGASVNRHPELFRAVIMDVPFVDVVTTMSDPSLPLTVVEWEQWGNPILNETDYANMLSYSPFDNVAAQEYPHLLLTGGLNDPRVSYWEPAKFAARVRERKTSPDSLVLLKTNMAAGHFAQSGLEDRLAEAAFKYSFLLQTVAPCLAAAQPPGAEEHEDTCHGCFAIFVAAATTAALVTLVLVLRPASRLRGPWRRLGGGGGSPWRQLSRGGGDDESDEEDDEEGEGHGTRLFGGHQPSDRDAGQEGSLSAEAQRLRRARQQQQQQQLKNGHSPEAARGQLQPLPAPHMSPPGAAAGAAGAARSAGHSPATPPRPPGGLELAQLGGGAGLNGSYGGTPGRPLSAIPESPSALSSASLRSA